MMFLSIFCDILEKAKVKDVLQIPTSPYFSFIYDNMMVALILTSFTFYC